MASSTTTQPAMASLQWPAEILDTPLTTDDLVDIKESLTPFSVNWYDIGINIGLPKYKLDIIDRDFSDTSRKLIQMISAWLSNDKNCTRRALLRALRNSRCMDLPLANVRAVPPMEIVCTMQNQALIYDAKTTQISRLDAQDFREKPSESKDIFVRKITMQYSPEMAQSSIQISQLAAVKTYLSRYRSQWQSIGQYFGVSQEELHEINEDNNNDLDKLEKTIKKVLLGCDATVAMLLQVVQESFPKETNFTITIHSIQLVIEVKNENTISAKKDFWNAKCELKSLLILLQALATNVNPVKELRSYLKIPVHVSDEVMLKSMRSYVPENIIPFAAFQTMNIIFANFYQSQAPLIILCELLFCELRNMQMQNNDENSIEDSSIDNSSEEIPIERIRDDYKKSVHNDLQNCLSSVNTSLKQTKTSEVMINTYDRHMFSAFFIIVMVCNMVSPLLSNVLNIYLMQVLELYKYYFLPAVHPLFQIPRLLHHLARHYELSIILLGFANVLVYTVMEKDCEFTFVVLMKILLLIWIKCVSQMPNVTIITASVIYNVLKTLAIQIFLGFLTTEIARKLYRNIKIRSLQQTLPLLTFTFLIVIMLLQTGVLTSTILGWALVGAILIYYKHIIVSYIKSKCNSRPFIFFFIFTISWKFLNYFTNYTAASFFFPLYWTASAAYISLYHKSQWSAYSQINHLTRYLEGIRKAISIEQQKQQQPEVIISY